MALWDAGIWDTAKWSTLEATASLTLDNITFAGTGALKHNGTLALTLADITFADSGTVTHNGTLALTLADITFAATGGKANIGTLAVVLEDLTFVATGSEIPPFLVDPRRGGIKAKKKEYKNNSADVKKAIEDAVEAVTGEPKPKVKVAPKVEEEANTFVEDYEAILRMETEKAALELAIAQMLEDERDDEEAILLLL